MVYWARPGYWLYWGVLLPWLALQRRPGLFVYVYTVSCLYVNVNSKIMNKRK